MLEPELLGPRKNIDQLSEAIRIELYSLSTEMAYIHCARYYLLFHNKHHLQKWTCRRMKPCFST